MTAPHLLHATTVEAHGKGLLIVGAAGRGKSALALELMAFGATLVSDDQTEIHETAEGLVAKAPTTIKNLVEARGVGILHAEAIGETRLHLVVNMDHDEKDRLPKPRYFRIGTTNLPCVHRVSAPHFAAALFQMLRAGRRDQS